MWEEFGGKEGECPVTEDISDSLLRLPFFNELTNDDQARVIEAVRCFGKSSGLVVNDRVFTPARTS